MQHPLELPKIHVVTAVHRTDRPVRRAVESVLECENAASIVVAHGINPADLALPTSPRVRVLGLRGHLGYPGPPKNLGVANASAPYVSLLDSDDWYENGALNAMFMRAEEHDLDIVLAPTKTPREGLLLSPVTLRDTELKASRDRLLYRTAVRGLFRLEVLHHPRHHLRNDLKTGEDMQPMLRMLTSRYKIGSFLSDPAYVLADDGGSRVSESVRPMEEVLRAITRLIDDGELGALNRKDRNSAVTKLLRVHILGPIERKCLQNTLTSADLREAARVTRMLRLASEEGTEVFSANDQTILGAIISTDIEQLRTAVRSRDSSSLVRRVLPSNLRYSFANDGNLRTSLVGSFLKRKHIHVN